MPFAPFDRRRVAGALALIGVAAALAPLPAAAATESKVYPLAALMGPQALPDVWVGADNAPITIIEYASMTCTHCAAFHAETWPTLKSKYIDTGKVRFVLREFPLDVLAGAGFMLARCAGPDKRNAMVDLLFDQQKNWAFVDHPLEALSGTVKQAGISQAAFEACLQNQTLLDQVNAVRDKGSKDFGVKATPTFYINGRKIDGEMSVPELDKQLEPLLPKG